MSEAHTQEVVRAWRRGELEGREIARSARRRSVLLHPPGAPAVLVKEFRTTSGNAAREALKRALGQSGADREWKALGALHRAGAPVPRPLARGREDRISWLAVEYSAGRTLDLALPEAGPALRRQLLAEAGRLVHALHALGYVHGDLHLGNLLLVDDGEECARGKDEAEDDSGAVALRLLDLQHAVATRRHDARERDIAQIEFSLARAGVGRAGRLRLRRAALPAASREALRAIGERVVERERDHARGRTRRCTVPGRRSAALELGRWRGLRLRELPELELERALAAHESAAAPGSGAERLKDDGRALVTRVALPGSPWPSVVVKEVLKSGAGRRLADALRGSPARRGWIAGHGLAARAIGSTLPLAFAEARGGKAGSTGALQRSLLVLEDLGRHSWLDDPQRSQDEDATCDALVRLLVSLHRQGVDHGDLQITHLYGSAPTCGEARRHAVGAPRLIDLEGVRFLRRCSDAQRIRALAELNASLPDAMLSASMRRNGFDRYARQLPFEGDRAHALREVIRLSMARRHRWTGADCGAAEALRSREP